MKTFRLIIITPKGVYLDKEVNELYLKTANGYTAILANHDTLISAVDIAPGFIVIDNKKEFYAIFEGILNVKKDCVQLIVSNIENVQSIDLQRAKKSEERALNRLNEKDKNLDIKRCEVSLKRAVARISAVNKDFI